MVNVLRSTTGSVWSWGDGAGGSLGDNTITNRSSPVSVVGGHSFSSIKSSGATGNLVALALKSNDGSAWAWGVGTSGQLGEGSVAVNRSSPVSVVGGHSFSIISAGNQNSAGLKSNDGSVWTWGSNASGQIGDNTSNITNRSSPVSVVGGHSFNVVSMGFANALAIKSIDGSAWSWGSNSGALGDNTISGRSSPVSVVGGHSFNAVVNWGAGGGSNGFGLKSSDGSVWGWGSNSGGALGDNTITNRSSPVSVVGGHSFNAIGAGGAGGGLYTFGLKSSDGSLWSWGYNGSGQLADGTAINRSSPVSVVGGHSFVKIATGGALYNGVNSYALKADGSVWSWGSRSSGALGNNADPNAVSPVSVVGGHSFDLITSSATSSSAFLAVKANDGSAWTWGSNNSGGLLGDNQTISNRSSPVSVVGGHSFTAIAMGQDHSIGLKSNDGSAWTWGSNPNGAIGDNTVASKSSPVSVVGGHSFTKIAAGNRISFGLKASDGSLWGWGQVSSGALGDNQTTSNRSSPVSVVGGHSFNVISNSDTSGLALKSSDGSAWTWGFNGGVLGDNTNQNRSSPVSVVGGHSFDVIASGSNNSYALKAVDGSVWAWGSGTGIGDNTLTTRSSPVSVVGAHSFNAIAGGGAHALALKSVDGSAWTWGNGTLGQLGDGTAVSKSSPVSVVGGHSFIKIGAGAGSSYALKSNGSVWSWGTRTAGALGNNTDQFLTSPIQIVATTNIKKILGVPYANYVFDDIGTGNANIGKTKKVGGTTTDNMKKILKITP